MPSLQIMFASVLLLSTGYAFVFGGKTGKAGATIFILATLLTMVTELTSVKIYGANLSVLLVDFGCLIALAILAFNSSRYWPIWALGFQIAGVSTHLAAIMVPDIVPTMYQLVAGFWSLPILAVMVIGTKIDRPYSIQTRN